MWTDGGEDIRRVETLIFFLSTNSCSRNRQDTKGEGGSGLK